MNLFDDFLTLVIVGGFALWIVAKFRGSTIKETVLEIKSWFEYDEEEE